MQSRIKEILLVLAQEKVNFILCGGVACVLQGVERMTMDVDVFLEMTDENIQRFLKAVGNLKMKPRADVSPLILKDPVKLKKLVKEKNARVMTFENKDSSFYQLDVMLDPTGGDYLKWIEFSEPVPIGKNIIRVLNRKALIKIKKKIKPLRPKDKFDLETLETLFEDSKSARKKTKKKD